MTLTGTASDAASVAAGFRPPGTTGSFILRGTGSPVVGGRFRVELLFEPEEIGSYERAWDGRDAGGDRVPPGIYLCRVVARVAGADAAWTGTVGVAY